MTDADVLVLGIIAIAGSATWIAVAAWLDKRRVERRREHGLWRHPRARRNDRHCLWPGPQATAEVPVVSGRRSVPV